MVTDDLSKFMDSKFIDDSVLSGSHVHWSVDGCVGLAGVVQTHWIPLLRCFTPVKVRPFQWGVLGKNYGTYSTG